MHEEMDTLNKTDLDTCTETCQEEDCGMQIDLKDQIRHIRK